MQEIKFIARRGSKSPTRPSEDVNIYSVEYRPPRGVVYDTGGHVFSNQLLEAVYGLLEYNPEKEPVQVTLEGNFPQIYLDRVRTFFDLYSRAEGVSVSVEILSSPAESQ